MNPIPTNDGTQTLYNTEFDENYHSTSGAFEEAQKKFIEPTKVQSGMTILDMCFGLGYNTLAAIEQFEHLHIIALENDKALFLRCLELTFEDPLRHALYQQLMNQVVQETQLGKDEFDVIIGTNTIHFILGDALQTSKQVASETIDVVFFDPFSPKKCPALWSQEIFADMYRVVKKTGILATYSCARMVRDNMKTVGFSVEDGPVVGRRAPSTMCRK